MSLATITEGSTAHRGLRYLAWGLFALLVLAAPFWAVRTPSFGVSDTSFTVSLGNVSHAIAFMVAVLGLGLLVGFNGQISLGNSFFVGLGAYISATLVADDGWPLLATLVVVVPVCFLVGMAIGVPALRIRGLYLALVTLGLAAVFPALVRLESLRERTGGPNGKQVGADFDPPSWLPLDGVAEFLGSLPVLGSFVFGDIDRLGGRDAESVWIYFLVVAVAGVCFWLTRNLIRSRPGRAIIAIRDSETGAAVSGVNLSRYKTLTFGYSAALGGVGGVLYSLAVGFLAPDVFGVNLAIFLIVGLVVGGVGTLSGAVVGGIVIIFVPLWASQVASVPGVPERYLRGPTGTLLLGLLLIVLTFVLPGGVVQGMRKLKGRVLKVAPGLEDSAVADLEVTAGQAERLLDRREPDRVSGI